MTISVWVGSGLGYKPEIALQLTINDTSADYTVRGVLAARLGRRGPDGPRYRRRAYLAARENWIAFSSTCPKDSGPPKVWTQWEAILRTALPDGLNRRARRHANRREPAACWRLSAGICAY